MTSALDQSHRHEANPDSAALVAFWRALRKNLWLVLTIAGALTAAVTFHTLGQTKIYRATATLQIDPTPPSPLGREVQTVVAMGTESYWSNQEYYETQYKLLESRRIAAEAARALGLSKDAAFLQNLPEGAEPRQPAPKSADGAGAVLGRLKVEPLKKSRLVNVSFEDVQQVPFVGDNQHAEGDVR